MAGPTRERQHSQLQSCPGLGADAQVGGSGGYGRNSPVQRQMEAKTAPRRCDQSTHCGVSAIPRDTLSSLFGTCSGGVHHTVLKPRSRVEHGNCHEQQRAALGATPTGQQSQTNGCCLRHDEQCFRHDEKDLADRAPLLYRQQLDALVDGQRQEADRGQSDSIGDGAINPAPSGFGNRQGHSTNRFTVSDTPGSGANGGTSNPFSGRHPSSDRATIEQQRLGGRTVVSGSEKLRPIGAPASGNDGGVPNEPPWTAMSTPANPQQWLQKLNLRQSRTGSAAGGGAAAALRSLSPPALPLASTSRISAGGEAVVPGPDDSPLPHAEGRLAAKETCPAADCPANGDCLPGATPEMRVFEVNFKRATRTFLAAKKSNHKSASFGTLMKVSCVGVLPGVC